MAPQPASAIVDVNVNARIAEERRDFRISSDQLQVTGIDLDDVDALDVREARDDARPRARAHADDQYATGRGMRSPQQERSFQAVRVHVHVDVDAAVVN